MSSSYNIYVPIYRFNLILVTADTAKQCEEESARLWAENNPQDPFLAPLSKHEFYGRFTVVESPHPDCRNMPVLSVVMQQTSGVHRYNKEDWKEQIRMNLFHECIHAAFHILNDRGVIVDANNHEALTYLVGYLQEECIGLMFPKKTKRKTEEQ